MTHTLPVPTLLSVTVFVRSGDDVLLMERGPHRAYEPNKFCGIGGKVDTGETILATAIRETREEAGLDLPAEAFTFRGSLILDGYPEARWVVTLFEAWTEQREVAQTDEGVLSWIPASEVMDNRPHGRHPLLSAPIAEFAGTPLWSLPVRRRQSRGSHTGPSAACTCKRLKRERLTH